MLTSLALAATLVMSGTLSAASNGTCPVHLQAINACGVSAVNDGTSVTVGGTQTTGGSNDNSPRSENSPSNRNDSSDAQTAPPAAPDRILCTDWEHEFIYVADCIRLVPEEDSSPVVTIHDLVRFLPNGAAFTVEPEGVGVVGLPANFVARTGPHTAHGMLFGRPMSVRFTPAGHTFHYGDGETRRASTGGRTWSALGVPQFTPTDTSHVYRERGTYVTRVDTRYTAELNLGYGWVHLSGELTSRGAEQSIRIYEARTALVAHTCDVNPAAAGC